MGKTYKNLIFTTHAYNRVKQRSISLHAIYDTIKHPDFTKELSETKTKYFKKSKNRKYQVVATYKNNEKKYLVISAWVRGETDRIPLVWQLLTLPFKLAWMLLKFLFALLKKLW